MELEIEAGKTYNIRTPLSYKKSKVHVDYILDNPTEPGAQYCTLIVYRIWLFRKRRWEHQCHPYYVLAIPNEWRYD